jgi:hypothetical protein
LLLLVACGDGGSYVYMDDDLPSENCPDTDSSACESTGGVTTATSSTTASEGDTTGGSSDACEVLGCEVGFCVAPFDGEIGEFVCVPDCIGIMDEALWCADASACCDADAVCTDRGYCVPSESGSESGGGSGESGSDSGGSGSEDGSAGSSDGSGSEGSSGG